MNHLYLRRFLFFLSFTLLVFGTCSSQSSYGSRSKNPEKELFGKSLGNTKKTKVKEPGTVHKAKRRQEKNEKRMKKSYAQHVKQSRKRSYDIQSPEVQARMKEDQKNTALRDKEKKKNIRSSTKKAGKKYA
jgi:hypothetical protein